MAPSWDCNTGTTTRPHDKLPPGWCIQSPIDGVSLWFNKRSFILKYNNSARPKRVSLQRTLGNGIVEQYQFVVENLRDAGPYVWLSGRDTGSILMTKVQDCPKDSSLEAVNKVNIVTAPNTNNRLKKVVNHWSVPVYVCFEIYYPPTSSTPDSLVQAVIRAGERRSIYDAYDGQDIRVRWRAAEWQRADLYAPWPPSS